MREVIGGLFFGHAAAGMFNEKHERLAIGMSVWAAVALENARLYANAQEASRLKDEFLATLSHELRTPLNAIVGYTRMMRSGLVTGEKAARALETVDRNANALTQIVEDVLDVSRIIAGKIRLNVRPVDLPHGRRGSARLDPAGGGRARRAAGSGARSARGAGVGRSGAAAAGGVEPGVERGEVHAARRTRAGAGPAGRLSHRDRGQRHGHRHSDVVPAARVRALPSVGWRHLARAGRARSRAGDRASSRRNARRDGDGRERWRGTGRDVPGQAAGDDRPRRSACAGCTGIAHAAASDAGISSAESGRRADSRGG